MLSAAAAHFVSLSLLNEQSLWCGGMSGMHVTFFNVGGRLRTMTAALLGQSVDRVINCSIGNWLCVRVSVFVHPGSTF